MVVLMLVASLLAAPGSVMAKALAILLGLPWTQAYQQVSDLVVDDSFCEGAVDGAYCRSVPDTAITTVSYYLLYGFDKVTVMCHNQTLISYSECIYSRIAGSGDMYYGCSEDNSSGVSVASCAWDQRRSLCENKENGSYCYGDMLSEYLPGKLVSCQGGSVGITRCSSDQTCQQRANSTEAECFSEPTSSGRNLRGRSLRGE